MIIVESRASYYHIPGMHTIRSENETQEKIIAAQSFNSVESKIVTLQQNFYKQKTTDQQNDKRDR